jgi:hypothetical protein
MRAVTRIHALLTDPTRNASYFPGEPRKGRLRMTLDLVLWLALRREVNEFYFVWGLDRVNAPRARELWSYREFHPVRQTRNRIGQGTGLDYVALMQDKYLFSLLMRALEVPSPSLLALLTRDRITWLNPRRSEPLDALLDVPDGFEAFCKPRFGQQGRAAFRLQVRDRVPYINGTPSTLDALAGRLRRHVMQEIVVQHPQLARLHPSSVNTLRIITVRTNGVAQRFSAPLLRIGDSGSVVDNAGSGGMQLFVDSDTGRVRPPGIRKQGGPLMQHPDTGVSFRDFEVPFLQRAVSLVTALHDDIPGLHSIGWDVAITESGPVIIEGNDDWAASLRLGLEPGFKQEFLRLAALP